MAAKLRHSAILWWAAEHFEGNSRDLAGTFLHNSVDFVVDGTSRISKEKKGLSPSLLVYDRKPFGRYFGRHTGRNVTVKYSAFR